MKLPSIRRARPNHEMPKLNPARSRPGITLCAFSMLAFSLAVGGSTLHAQNPDTPASDPDAGPRRMPHPNRFSKLPPTHPTELQPPATPLPPPATPLPPPATPLPLPAGNALPAPLAATPVAEQPITRPHRAQVNFSNGQLNVRADDSSLNQILHAISRETGLKITGGVKDQRVFGNYGPASTSAILATLLDGTGTNIVLLEGAPPELVLTPRGGGPTPPSPTDPNYVDDSIEAQAPPPPPIQTQPQPRQQPQTGPISIPQPLNNINGSPLNTSPTASTLPTTNSVPTDSLPTPSTTPSTSGIVDAPNPPAPGSTTGTAPNQTATPEQIYQQLLLQQRQQQSAQPSPTPPPAQPQNQP